MGGRVAATAVFVFGAASVMREGVMVPGPLDYVMLTPGRRFFFLEEIHGTLSHSAFT